MQEMTTNESLGSYVKKMRDEKNISIEQVAYATRISLKMLRALEEDDHTALPAPTFVRGYLQAYAKYVRIDTQDLLLRYQHHLASEPDNKKGAIRSHYLYVRERYQEKRRLVLVIVLFAVMLSVAGTYFLLKAKRERNKLLAQQAEQIQKSEGGTEDGAAKAEEGSSDPKGAKSYSPEKAELPKLAEPVKPKPVIVEPVKKPEPIKAEPVKPAEPPKPAPLPKVEAPKVEAPKPAPAPVVAAPAPPPAPVKAPVVVAPAAPAPATAPTPAPPTVAKTETTAAAAPAISGAPTSEKKTYNLLVRAEQDVWIRFQTDEDSIRDLTLRSGKAIMLRANKVVKLFSGNLGALKATMNGAPMPLASGDNKSKSIILPASESANYSLPLFPPLKSATPKEGAAANPASGQKSP